MNIPFFKLDGAGNDFVVIDNREGRYQLDEEEIARICHRRFGVGADGLMTLDTPEEGFDFVMNYYNSDGRLGSMCGNGGRCIAALAHELGMGKHLRFKGFDGEHDAVVRGWDGQRGTVDLGMRDVLPPREVEGGLLLDTGSPHFVLEVSNLEAIDVVAEGRRLRQRADLFPEGVNVDFVQRMDDDLIAIRTYERGVEDETWACGTGVVAAALVTGTHQVQARGGNFMVKYEYLHGIRLIGPAALNFSGRWISSQA